MIPFNETSSEKRLTEEEWRHLRFGSDATQWALNSGADNSGSDTETETESGDNTNGAIEASVETNLQTVDVGKDKLVLVNDEGTIKMLRASQLPLVPKPNGDKTSTQTPVLQMPYNTYIDAKGSNSDPSNPIEYISPNFGAGHKVAGLPVAFASSTKQNRPKVIYQNFDEHPCRVATTTPPIYIPAPQIDLPNDSSRSGKMVRIIIEMPESMTRNIDEASRYAASQVRKLKIPNGLDMNQSSVIQLSNAKQQSPKKVKNVREIIRKVIHLEDVDEDGNDKNKNQDIDSNHDGDISQQRSDHEFTLFDNNRDSNTKDNVFILRNGERVRRRNRRKGLKQVDKYKKVIKIYSS